jgi:hypothetical protein
MYSSSKNELAFAKVGNILLNAVGQPFYETHEAAETNASMNSNTIGVLSHPHRFQTGGLAV